MKIDNFELIEVTGTSATSWRYKATVDVTTWFWWWKKTKTVVVAKEYAANWFWMETGKWTPGTDVECLARAYAGKQGKDLEYCK
jgi:hypothetical protein